MRNQAIQSWLDDIEICCSSCWVSRMGALLTIPLIYSVISVVVASAWSKRAPTPLLPKKEKKDAIRSPNIDNNSLCVHSCTIWVSGFVCGVCGVEAAMRRKGLEPFKNFHTNCERFGFSCNSCGKIFILSTLFCATDWAFITPRGYFWWESRSWGVVPSDMSDGGEQFVPILVIFW